MTTPGSIPAKTCVSLTAHQPATRTLASNSDALYRRRWPSWRSCRDHSHGYAGAVTMRQPEGVHTRKRSGSAATSPSRCSRTSRQIVISIVPSRRGRRPASRRPAGSHHFGERASGHLWRRRSRSPCPIARAKEALSLHRTHVEEPQRALLRTAYPQLRHHSGDEFPPRTLRSDCWGCRFTRGTAHPRTTPGPRPSGIRWPAAPRRPGQGGTW